MLKPRQMPPEKGVAEISRRTRRCFGAPAEDAPIEDEMPEGDAPIPTRSAYSGR
jgi:hypothetical protein